MKPSLFDYCAPNSVAEAVEALSSDPGAMILAGGQSLVPAMNLRLASPTRLVDLRNIPDLRTVAVEDDVIRIGAMVRHRDIELDDTVNEANPLIRAAMNYVAHVPIRNRGTVVGSICHADAAAEMPLVLLVTDGSVTAEGPGGRREIPADDFFQFHMTTTRAADEVITHASIPAMPHGAGYAFEEFARRHGDYAIAGVAAIVQRGADGAVTAASIGACGVGSRPVRLTSVEEAITGTKLSEDEIKTAAQSSQDYVTAPDDMHATTAYRRHLLVNLVRRVLSSAGQTGRS